MALERRSFHFSTCAFLPALGCLPPPPALYQLGAAQQAGSSQKHRRSEVGKVEVGRGLWRSPAQPLLWQGHPGWVPSPTLMQILEMSKNGDSTASLHPVPVLDHPHRRKMFADVQSELPVFHFVPTASAPGTG